jgi:regulatory protein
MDAEAAVKSALRLLKARGRTRREIDSALERKGCPPDVRASTLERLAGWGYLDDGRFARQRALVLLREGRGARAVLHALEGHGVAPALAREAAAAAERELGQSPEALARQVLSKRRLVAPLDRRARLRAGRLLAGRGFSEEVIERVLGASALDPPPEDE